MRTLVAAAALLSVAGPAYAAAAMNSELFFQKAQALKAKGPMALFSRDLRVLKAEGTAAGEKARAARLAAVKGGRSPRYCPPSGSRRMDSTEFLDRLGRIAPAERRLIDMDEAMNRILAGKFPCPR